MVSVSIYASPFGTRQLGQRLQERLDSGEWKRLSGAVAWVKLSGVRHISKSLQRFVAAGGTARIAIGIDNAGSTVEGLDLLAEAVAPSGEIWIVHHNNPATTFHPKVYLLENDRSAVAFIGSGNLTEGGLFSNFEMGTEIDFDLASATDLRAVDTLRSELNNHLRASPIAQPLSPLLRKQMLERGDIDTELQAAQKFRTAIGRRVSEPRPPLFGTIPIPAPPRPQVFNTPSRTRPRTKAGTKQRAVELREETRLSARGFVMTLQQTDAGVGQRTKGASRRSPELFIPLAARDADPNFWGWPALFIEDAARRGKFDRAHVPFRLGADTINVNMMTWPVKHDFRLRSEQLRSATHVGDILRIERAERGTGFEYFAEIVPNGATLYPYYVAICTEMVRNSKKRWGYYA